MENMKQEGFIYAEHLALFAEAQDPMELMQKLESHQSPPGLNRWVDREGLD